MDTIGLLIISAIPTVIGVTQALRFKEKADEEAKKGPKWFNLLCVTANENDPLYGGKIVLVGKKLLIDTREKTDAFLFKGLFHDYIGTEIPGLVSHIGTDPPALNWIFVEDEEVKYGTGSESKEGGKIVGPWSYKGGLHLQEKALFYAGREVEEGRWELKYGQNNKGTKVLIAMATIPDEAS
ncbi:hypothetical protein TWF225_005821 [Orbilia oligospora]|uniref:Uncharacterized protein n=1 Tax=Orbilia oligospora TaxID=2813651 RepID=A0A7C8PMH7_ORBOL|nr:hypothetical protein TWF751_005107 [Orbilia oligospora]KAF3184914.1 hypothetical protein TWF225_005821 [Orbilia oligospora]KAF3271250.1 hypothetical protein TWF217_005653 [Orbilia oligospora]KAF3271801.1 hypothetical protein TWF128_000338 [Orbilia oligospora]KAF3293612.1 hypothetical protein TWF132_004577 [Orbilia oligospora]